MLTFEAGVYPRGFVRSLPLTFPRDPGPQNYFFEIALVGITDGVTAGGLIGAENPQEVCPEANITIRDDGKLLSNAGACGQSMSYVRVKIEGVPYSSCYLCTCFCIWS